MMNKKEAHKLAERASEKFNCHYTDEVEWDIANYYVNIRKDKKVKVGDLIIFRNGTKVYRAEVSTKQPTIWVRKPGAKPFDGNMYERKVAGVYSLKRKERVYPENELKA